ncbi:Cof-type HAD-IIB family hydrolase [Salicibibacter halophilus]|uniref:Cof-type HAD-IIB family hydrolase n=1 Tax=Salicibibacter halophilus TaxID=2502791 RepID=A0A514LGI6_9BACI|nr:Cof-type HAD-IIB family hydrolase [Salicibibacter halophilus]QDI90655.1 Cof-type HAD-IIB family hydrolase [Salicibibacter halophilus]
MTKKMVFFDIDGTLYDDSKKVPATAKKAIRALKDGGHEVAIATGRAPFMFEQLRKELEIDTFVSFNGSYVVVNGEVVLARSLQRRALGELHEDAMKKQHVMVFMDHKSMLTDVKDNSRIAQCLGELKMPYPSISIHPRQGDIYQALLFTAEQEAFTYNEYRDFSFVRWHELSVDVLPAAGSKAKGVQKAADMLQVDIKDTFAFGDALNDVEMLEHVGTGVAMGNGLKEAKASADFTTTAVHDDGIANGLKKLGLVP